MSYLDEYRKKLVKASNIIKLIDPKYDGMEYDYLIEALVLVEEVQDDITSKLILLDDKNVDTKNDYPDILDIKKNISDSILEDKYSK